VQIAGLACPGFMPSSSLVGDAFVETGRIPEVVVVAGAGDPLTFLGQNLLPKIRALAPAAAVSSLATRRSRSMQVSVHPGIGGRDLSHLAGATPDQCRSPRALAKTGACGQLGSRTANRMAGHRALPLGSVRAPRG
jgi:hypothetical protein